MIEERAKVASEGCASRTVRRLYGLTETTMIERHAGVSVAKKRNLLPPRQVAAPSAVRPDENRGFPQTPAMNLVVEIRLIARNEWHAAAYRRKALSVNVKKRRTGFAPATGHGYQDTFSGE